MRPWRQRDHVLQPSHQRPLPVAGGGIQIADLHHAGLTITAIAVQVGRDKSTISRELRRNAGKHGYRPFEAHRAATARRGRAHRRRVETNVLSLGSAPAGFRLSQSLVPGSMRS